MAALSVEEIAPPPPLPPAPAGVPGEGVCAVVLYDYEAEEENEMSLTEGETIEQIEQIDEGEIIKFNITIIYSHTCHNLRLVVWRGSKRDEEWVVPR